MPASSPLLLVLRSSDLLLTIGQFQDGLWDDMVPFHRLNPRQSLHLLHHHRSPILDASSRCGDSLLLGQFHRVVDALLLPWLERHGLDRVVRLVDALPYMRAIVVENAVLHNRLDILQFMHKKYTLDACHDQLYHVAAAGHADVSTIEWLRLALGLPVGGLVDAARCAARHNNIPQLRCLCDHSPEPVQDTRIFLDLAQHGQVDALTWFYAQWAPVMTAAQACQLVKMATAVASKTGQLKVARWLETKTAHGAPMLAVLDESDRRRVLQSGLRTATMHGHMKLMRWFTHDVAMVRSDVGGILRQVGADAMRLAAQRGTEDLAQCLLSWGVALPVEALMDTVTHDQATMRLWLLEHGFAAMGTHARGEFVVRAVQLMTHEDHTFLLHLVYDKWKQLDDNDGDEAKRVKFLCLATAKQQSGGRALRVLLSKGLDEPGSTLAAI
ncbi:Aste57867_21158 [Aphanomyces stellatus]|uniref:Aste57867_21158 protein n=1 Tax=Aphanomyces stellatus TaxID=120398 RepID=A0A485LI86_9STRA|nr:hypothetical protein As57867_021090 [Aphanomyces stellatus]VFT97832.1 Aste57867_21158 [Aphanomyces stellatus]